MRKILVLLLTVFALGAFFAPTPALASKCCGGGLSTGDVVAPATESGLKISEMLAKAVEWVKKNEFLKDIISWTSRIMQFLDNMIESLTNSIGDSARTQNAVREMKTETEVRAADAVIDSRARNAVDQKKLQYAADHAMPLPSEQFLCNLLLTRQVVPVMVEFARIISRVVNKGMDERYTSKTSDGTGPQYISDAWKLKCGKYGTNWPKTGTILDGAPEECREGPTTPTIGYADSDVSIEALSTDKSYVMPPIKDVEKTIDGVKLQVKDVVPDEGNEAQRGWIIARQYCYNLAGPRVTPPYGVNIDTPDGQTKFAKFTTCMARQSAFNKKCADRLGKLTRPDCSNDDFKVFCQASMQACDAAREANIALPPEYNNCADGLSLYQAEYLSNQLCGSTRRIQADKISGTTEPKAIRTLVMCKLMDNAWKKQIQEEESSFRKAVLGIQEMKDCWAGSGR
jgi:hypothetical protein